MRTHQDLISLAYVVKGFWAHIDTNSDGYRRAKEKTGGGEDHLMAALLEVGSLDEALWQERYANPGEDGPWFDGVWYYEISEPFGKAIAQHVHAHGDMPARDEAQKLLQTIHDNTRREA